METAEQPAIVRRVEFVRGMTETELRNFALYLCGRAPAVVAEYMADREAAK